MDRVLPFIDAPKPDIVEFGDGVRGIYLGPITFTADNGPGIK